MKPASARTQNRSTYRMTDQHVWRWGKRENTLAMLDIPCFDNIHDTAFPAGQQLDTVTVAGVASSPAGTGVHSSTAGVYSVYIQYSGAGVWSSFTPQTSAPTHTSSSLTTQQLADHLSAVPVDAERKTCLSRHQYHQIRSKAEQGRLGSSNFKLKTAAAVAACFLRALKSIKERAQKGANHCTCMY